jgi:tetratricopeptide (TPR) repeat protein
MTIQFFRSKSMKNLAMRFQHFSPRVQTSRLLVLNLIIILGGCEAAAPDDPWMRFIEQAKPAIEKKQYVEAERLYLAAVNESGKPGNDPSRRIQSLVQLASVCRRQNRPAQALPLSRQGVDLGEQLPSPGNPEALTSALNDLAQTYLNLGRLAEGELFVRKALNEGESHLGPDHLELSWSLSLQACLYSARRNFRGAELGYLEEIPFASCDPCRGRC